MAVMQQDWKTDKRVHVAVAANTCRPGFPWSALPLRRPRAQARRTSRDTPAWISPLATGFYWAGVESTPWVLSSLEWWQPGSFPSTNQRIRVLGTVPQCPQGRFWWRWPGLHHLRDTEVRCLEINRSPTVSTGASCFPPQNSIPACLDGGKNTICCLEWL